MSLSRRNVLLSYAVGCIVAASLAVLSPVVQEASAYTPRAMISIAGDAGFTAGNGVTGGTGTAGDPYVISGWAIDAGGSAAIQIRNTDAYFVISDCYLHDSSWYVVYLEDAHNGTFLNNSVSSGFMGVSAQACQNMVITNNTISDIVYYGLDLALCNGTYVAGNTLSRSAFFGMVISNCVGLVLEDNSFIDDGIIIWGTTLEEYNTHDIDSSNTINGLPVLYFADEVDLEIDSVVVGQVLLANCTNVLVTGLDISGPEVGVFSAFCTNETISYCNVDNASYSLWFWESQDAWVHDNTILNACNNHTTIPDSGAAVYGYSCDGMLIDHNFINNSDFGTYLGVVANVTFQDNTVSFGTGASAFGAYSATGVAIENNNMSSKDGSVTIWDSSGLTVVNNTMFGNYNQALYLLNATVVTLEGNLMVDNGFGARFRDIYDARVAFNTVTGGGAYVNVGQYGIDVNTGTNITLANNTVSDVPDGGVKLTEVDGVLMFGNHISSNLNDGVLLFDSQDMSLLNNTIEYNGDDGIFETGGSGTFEIVGNYIGDNLDSGIETSFAAEIAWNTVSNNDWYGIGLAGVGSTVHQNNILGNLIQAFQNDGYPNEWDNGYPDGGNYWSDYAGIDVMSGPGQDLDGSDGIGDTPRIVPVGEEDRYPLMEPVGWNRPPVATFDVTPTTGDTSTVFEFNASGSWDHETPAGDLMFRWDWDGDGTWDTGWSNSSTATHQFDTAGNYSVKLQVRDTNGTEAEHSLTVEVVEVIPEWSTVQLSALVVASCLLVLALSSEIRRRNRRRSG